MTAKVQKKVSRRCGLPNVGPYREWPEHLRPLRDTIAGRIRAAIGKELPGVHVEIHNPNTFQLGADYGFSFGLSKFDKGFTENIGAHEFRYKDRELWKAVAKVIRETPELRGNYRWDRGFGVFVVNLFLEERAP